MTDAHPAQADLIPGPPAPTPAVFLQKLEDSTGEYTAERLRAQRPDDYQQIIFLLAQGNGPQAIEDWFHANGKKLSKNTAKQVRRLEGETIDLLKERIAAEAFTAADDYRDAARSILADIMSDPSRRREATIRDVQSLEVASGIATQNAQLLSGQPTARLAVQDLRPPGHDDFNRMLASLPSANVIDVSTHSEGERHKQKDAAGRGDAAGAATGPAAGAGDQDNGAQTDSQSAGNAVKDQ